MNILLIGNIYFKLPKIIEGHNITVLNFLKRDVTFIGRLKRRFYLKRNSPKQLKYFRLEETINCAKQSDVVILFDSTSKLVLNEYAAAIESAVNLSNTKLFFYFWNSITSLDGLKLSPQWKINTFDKIDADRYKFRYIGGFYHPQVIIKPEHMDNDFCFVGRNKNRFKLLSDIEKTIISSGLKAEFIYVDNWKSIFSKKYCKYIPYSSVINLVSRSKAILDITASGQYGLTLRFYESLFYNKKIVTNNTNIREYNLYNRDNILIIDQDTSAIEFQEFINKSYIDVGDIIRNQYTFSAWLERILNPCFIFNDTIR